MILNYVKAFFVLFTLSGQLALNCEHRVLYVIGIVCVGSEGCCIFVLFRRQAVLNAYPHILRRPKARMGLNIRNLNLQIRMDSSRMRTGRSLTVCRGGSSPCPGGGSPCQGGSPCRGGLLARGGLPTRGVLPARGCLPARGVLPAGRGSPCPGGLPARGVLPARDPPLWTESQTRVKT